MSSKNYDANPGAYDPRDVDMSPLVTTPAGTQEPPATPPQVDDLAAERERTATLAGYRRRRRNYSMLGALVLVAVIFAAKPWSTITGQYGPDAGAPAVTKKTSAKVVGSQAGDMLAARDAVESGDAAGLHSPGALVAAAGQTVYISRRISGVCTVYGYIAGKEIVPVTDDTNAACTPAQMSAVQAQISAAKKVADTAATSVLDDALSRAANTVAQYVALGIGPLASVTHASFDGTDLPNVEVVTATPSLVKVRVFDGQACRVASINAAGSFVAGPAGC